MAEYYPVELGRVIAYEGYFDCAHLIKHIRKTITSKNYDYVEKDHNEIVKDHGKDLYISLDLDRYVSDYVKLRLEIKISIKGLKDAVVEFRDASKRVNDGRINIKLSSWVVTDYEGRYEGRGLLFYWRTLLEKFIFGRQIEKFKRLVKDDMNHVVKEVKAYLNLRQY